MKEQSRQFYQKVREVEAAGFDDLALELFRYQARANPVYREYLRLLGVRSDLVRQINQIPFLPIELFKSHPIQSGDWNPELEFTSSGTTGSIPSKHLVRSLDWYAEQASRGFRAFYGPPADYCFLALLPHYLDRQGSSLVRMVQEFMTLSKYPHNGFFLRDQDQLIERIRACQDAAIPTVLIGVSFALWELAESHPMDLSGLIVMETGGMKGQRRELIRSELHEILCQSFQLEKIHSEYGMTELLSQAYALENGRFFPSPTMKVLLSDITDPFSEPLSGNHGQLRIIDLANVDSCSFIATEDLGRLFSDGSFEVQGRLDRAAWRGCNLMVDSPGPL
ncbi:MAG: acyl transferase [Saprospiraceae bacterium]|nr:acyl transferase [Saprospiraceae bacterium]